VIVPDLPEEFVVEFLPSFFKALSAPRAAEAPRPAALAAVRTGTAVPKGAARPSARATAPAAVGIRVVGVNEWTLRITPTEIAASAGVAVDVALQVSLLASDFAPLVVEPVRRAVAALDAGKAPAASLWSRLGRWDQETVELLRQQTGRILVRVDDHGTVRKVALTPGVQPYSLDHAECTIDCKMSDLLDLQAKQTSPLDLFYAGQIRIAGDAQIALAMAGLFL